MAKGENFRTRSCKFRKNLKEKILSDKSGYILPTSKLIKF